jgi:hypothetical protein
MTSKWFESIALMVAAVLQYRPKKLRSSETSSATAEARIRSWEYETFRIVVSEFDQQCRMEPEAALDFVRRALLSVRRSLFDDCCNFLRPGSIDRVAGA